MLNGVQAMQVGWLSALDEDTSPRTAYLSAGLTTCSSRQLTFLLIVAYLLPARLPVCLFPLARRSICIRPNPLTAAGTLYVFLMVCSGVLFLRFHQPGSGSSPLPILSAIGGMVAMSLGMCVWMVGVQRRLCACVYPIQPARPPACPFADAVHLAHACI